MEGVTVRYLTRDEAATVPGMMDPQPDSLFVVGAVNAAGEVVAALGIFLALCSDPLWIREDHRNGKGKTPLLYHLWQAAKKEVLQRGGAGLEVLMLEGNPGPPYEGIVEKLVLYAGGHEVRGRHFFVPVGGE